MAKQLFSDELETWLSTQDQKTFASLDKVFGRRSFAIVILVLMFIPALPLPTGGVTHVFELITMLLAIEMLIGRTTIWLPKSWRQHELGSGTQQKAIPFLVKRIKWFEKFSRPRLSGFLTKTYFTRVVAVIILVLTLTSFIAPPFSGLDTIPALGVVMIALALILGDIVLLILGCVVGAIGIGLVIALGAATLSAFRHLF